MQRVSTFYLDLTPDQADTLNQWRELLRWTWNEGLGLLLELEAKTALSRVKDQSGKTQTIVAPACPFAVAGDPTPLPGTMIPGCPTHQTDSGISAVPVKTAYYGNKLVIPPSTQKEVVWGEHCWIIAEGRNGGTVNRWDGMPTSRIEPELIRVGQCCPLPPSNTHWRPPRLPMEVFGKYTLQYFFTQKNITAHPHYSTAQAEMFKAVPSAFVRGVCKALTVSWSGYKAGRIGMPKFKRQENLPRSLSHEDGKQLSVKHQEIIEDGHPIEAYYINIPKLGDVRSRGLEDWGNRPIKVARLVLNDHGNWELQLTGWEVKFGDTDVDEFAKVEAVVSEKEQRTIADHLKWFIARWSLAEAMTTLAPKPLSSRVVFALYFEVPLWNLKRNKSAILQIVGENYTLAIDDQGTKYTALPRRHTDGAIDPNQVIDRINEEIEVLERQIAWRVESHKQQRKAGMIPGRGNLQRLRQKKAALMRRRTAILSSNRQKIAHFISERSRSVKVIVPPVTPLKKPNRKLKRGEIDPAVFEPNGAEIVAEINRARAATAPKEFISQLQMEAEERGQRITVIETAKSPKKAKSGVKSGGKKPKK